METNTHTPKKKILQNGSLQLVWHNPCFWKPKLIFEVEIFTLATKLKALAWDLCASDLPYASWPIWSHFMFLFSDVFATFKSPYTAAVQESTATLFCCEASEMFHWPWNFFGWIYPLSILITWKSNTIHRLQKQPTERERNGQRLQYGWVAAEQNSCISVNKNPAITALQAQRRRLTFFSSCGISLPPPRSDFDGKLWKWVQYFWDAAGRFQGKHRKSKGPRRGQEECSLCCNSSTLSFFTISCFFYSLLFILLAFSPAVGALYGYTYILTLTPCIHWLIYIEY